jgi:TPR repeat protein
MLPEPIAYKLMVSDNPYERYAYGLWLWSCRKDIESLKTAFGIFEESAHKGIADALQMMSRMYYLGEAYDEETGKFVMDRKLSQELTSQAVEKGSILAKLRRNKNLFFGTTEVSADKVSAISEAERESSAIFSESILWTEQLGWFYEIEDEREKAIKAYEKCIINGYYAPIYDLALMYLEDGDEGYYKTLMELGIDLGVPDCRILGMENEYRWDSLSGDERLDIYRQLNRNLPKGIDHGSGICAYILADALLNGKFGYDIDLDWGKTYADLALTYGFSSGASLVIDAAEALQDPEFISDDDLLKLRYDALRYGNEDQLDYVIRNKETYIEMGYGDQIEKVWMPLWKKNHPEAKTQVSPSAIIIQPSGIASVVEADIFCMSYREMAQLIGAEGLDAVHFSEPLNQITKACAFRGYQIAMYADRNGYAKDLPDNAIGTMLYGTGAEIRGAVIIALEDNKYDTHSFHFQEDIDNVLAAISDMTSGLARRGQC